MVFVDKLSAVVGFCSLASEGKKKKQTLVLDDNFFFFFFFPEGCLFLGDILPIIVQPASSLAGRTPRSTVPITKFEISELVADPPHTGRTECIMIKTGQLYLTPATLMARY